MKQNFVPLEKRSKKEQKAWHSAQRRTWDGFNPVTRSIPSGKAYGRRKAKREAAREIREGSGPALFFLCLTALLLRRSRRASVS